MKLIFSLSLLLSALAVNAGVFVYTGVYQGKDLYVKNPFSSDGVGFCVFEVKVNGKITSDEVNSSAFAIDLAQFGFKVGQQVEVIIRTKDECEPHLINPNAIAPASTCTVKEMSLSSTKLNFKTEGETADLPFFIEQFKWNKWVVVAVVDGKGQAAKSNAYAIEVPVIDGMNKFRVRQDDGKGVHYLMEKEVAAQAPDVTLLHDKVYDKVEFSGVTSFEVYDAFGVLVQTGSAKMIDCQAWQAGMYYLNFDNEFGRVVRKR